VISNIKLQNYKNLSLELNFTNGRNIIVGKNGRGKTNLLESIFTITNGFSFKSQEDENVINWSFSNDFKIDPFYSINAEFKFKKVPKESEETKEQRSIFFQKKNMGRKLFKINDKPKSSSSFNKQISALLFAPQSIDLISGSPSLRRNELDDFLSVYKDSFVKVLDEYRQVVRSRNKLLQINPSDISKQIGFWNEKASELGSIIMSERIKVLEEIQKEASIIAKDTYHFGDNSFDLQYFNKYIEPNNFPTKKEIYDLLLDKLTNNLYKEIAVGTTLYGPHRDDVIVKLNDHNLRESGSRGQQRLASFIIKVSEYSKLKSIGKEAILLIDDLPSELDYEHIANAEKLLLKMDCQIIASVVEVKEYSKIFVDKSNLIELDKLES